MARLAKEPSERYQQAAASGQFVVFLRDTKKKVLRSYVLPVDEQA